MVFMYFLPRVMRGMLVSGEKISAAVLTARGLGKVLADVSHPLKHATISEVQRGPDGGPGTLIVPTPGGGGVPDVTIYQPALQQWRAFADGGAWIGYVLTKPPTPESLLRRENFGGYIVPDASGRRWCVPVARSPRADGVTLPRTFRFDEATGKPTAKVAAAYHALWEAACELYEWWSYISYEQQVEAGHLPTPEVMPERPALAERDENWMIETALSALAVNYRIGPVELNTLAEIGEVLTNAVVMQMTLALFDRQIEAEYWEKKTRAAAAPAHDLPPSSPGEPAGCPNTAPASAN